MDDKTWLSSLAEMRTICRYTEDRWEVFSQVSGKAPFDLVAYRDGELRRVQVKACATRSRTVAEAYCVQLRSIRSNKTTNVIRKLDPQSYDELALYIQPWDRLFFLTPGEVDRRDTITISVLNVSQFREHPWK